MKFENIIFKINRFLTPKRLNYAWILGGALWIGWIISMIAGKGNTDFTGHLIGTDFASFYTAGKIILLGKSPELYNLELANSIQQTLYNGTIAGFYPYLYPPLYALLMVPFALIPYPLAPLIWIAFGLVCLWVSIKILNPGKLLKSFFLSLTWFPVFSVASFGQNSFFTLLIFCLTYYLWLRKRYLITGLVFSLLVLKPQLLIGVCFLWLLEGRRSWKALLGLGIGICCQIGLSLWLFPKASLAYISYVQEIIPKLQSIEGSAIWHIHSMQAFWYLLLPNLNGIVQLLYLICVLIGSYYFILFWRKHSTDRSLAYAAAIIWLIWSIPYISIYDWSLLLIPGLILWENLTQFRPLWTVIFAIVWLTTLISSPLTYLQLKILPMAVQISIPVLLVVIFNIYQTLMKKPYLNSIGEITKKPY